MSEHNPPLSPVTSIECASSVLGLELNYNDANSTAYLVHCKPTGPAAPAGNQNISQAEFNVCNGNLLNGLIRFNVPTVKVTGCVSE
jgi:hypothetical protein